MARSVLHIGTYKTGTSSLQRFLRNHEETLLHPNGYRFPRGWLRRDNHLEIHLALMRLDRLSTPRARKDEWRSDAFRSLLRAQISRDRDTNGDLSTIYSAEDVSLLRFDDELADLRRLIGDAVIVVYWREPTEWLASLADQLEKAGIGTSDDRDAFNYIGTDGWQVDYPARTAQWQEHFSDVTTFDYDACVKAEGSIIPSFVRFLGLNSDGLDLRAPEYWMNRRGEREQRIDGNRWVSGLPFGVPLPTHLAEPAPTSPTSVGGSEPHQLS